jgi:hypothetical protein
MGEEMGPVSSSELVKQAQAGVITPDTFVRQANDENWHVAQSVAGLFQKRAAGRATEEAGPPPVAPPPSAAQTRETAKKLCARIDAAMSGIRGEVEDEELGKDQIAELCDTLRPIAKQLEELEGSL